MAKKNPFKYFKTSPEIIKLAVMYCVRFPLSLRQVEDILHERGIGISHETVCFWWNRHGQTVQKFASFYVDQLIRTHLGQYGLISNISEGGSER